MPEKTSEQGRKYDVDGRKVIWHPEDDEGEQGNLPDVRLPLRIKMGLVLDAGEMEMDNSGMVRMLELLIPNQIDTIREMDVNDFQDMFVSWQSEYNTLTGASVGESGASGS